MNTESMVEKYGINYQTEIAKIRYNHAVEEYTKAFKALEEFHKKLDKEIELKPDFKSTDLWDIL